MGHAQKIVVVQAARGALELAILGLDAASKLKELLCRGRAHSHHRIDKAIRRLGFKKQNLVFGKRLARARSRAGQHAGAKICHGLFACLEGVDSGKRRAGAFGGTGARLQARAICIGQTA